MFFYVNGKSEHVQKRRHSQKKKTIFTILSIFDNRRINTILVYATNLRVK